MKISALIIKIIASLYALAALSALFAASDWGVGYTLLYMLVCFAMSFGLWHQKKWAWIVEIAICLLQLVIALVILANIVLHLDQLKLPYLSEWGVVFLVAVSVLNGALIAFLVSPPIRKLFH